MKGIVRISIASVVVTLAMCVASNAFRSSSTPQTRQQPSTTRLEMNKAVWGSVASALLGMTLAGQVASATNLESRNLFQELPSTITVVETLDFSLPSYSDSIKGEVKAKKDIPSFNPFGDFQPDFVKPDTSADDDEKAVKKAEEKAAVEAKRAEEKAAAEAKRAEVREARRAKQLEDAERADSTPAPTQSLPSIPEFKAPDIVIPEFKVPEITIPDFKAPDFSKFAMPKVEFDSSKVDMPKLDMPKLDMPKVDLPSFSFPSFGGASAPTDTTPKQFAPQEVRDEAARQAKQEYLKYDEMAKEVEAQARAARETANEKLADAKVAKDVACETRPGGKFICLRNPFTAGF